MIYYLSHYEVTDFQVLARINLPRRNFTDELSVRLAELACWITCCIQAPFALRFISGGSISCLQYESGSQTCVTKKGWQKSWQVALTSLMLTSDKKPGAGWGAGGVARGAAALVWARSQRLQHGAMVVPGSGAQRLCQSWNTCENSKAQIATWILVRNCYVQMHA